MPRLAVVYNNRGAYFHARLRAAAKLGDLAALQLVAGDSAAAPPTAHRILLTDSEAEQASAALIAARVHDALTQCAPNVVAVHGWVRCCALAALAWCCRTRTPAVMLADFQAVGRKPHGLRDWAKRRLLRYCGACVVTGNAHADYLAALGMPRERIAVGFGVADNAHFADAADYARQNAAALRQQFGLPERYFLAVSRLAPEKNLGALLEAYAAYRRSAGPQPWQLVIAGDGPLRAQLMRHCNALGLLQDVILAGHKTYDEIPVYYGLASAFVHASATEPWGLVVNEAMAAGLPVLVSERCGCAADLVVPGENGFIFDPRDVHRISQLLAQCANGSLDLPAMGRKSAARIHEWSPARFGEALWRAANQALGTAPPQVCCTDGLLMWALQRRPSAPR